MIRPEGRGLNPSGLEFTGGVQYFQTTSYFDLDGVQVPMGEVDDYSLIDGDLFVRYGYGPRLELNSGLRVRYIESVFNNQVLTTSGLESGSVGLRWLFPNQSQIDYALDISVRSTFYTNELYRMEDLPSDELVLGDSGTSFLVGGNLSYESPGSFNLNSRFYYHRAPGNLSDEFIYHLEALVPFQKMALMVGLDGAQSLNQDNFAEQPQLKEQLPQGATSLFNSINRSYIRPYIGASYAFNNFYVTLKGARVMAGQSTDEGNLIGMSITYVRPGATAAQMRVDRFKEYYIEATVTRVSPRAKFVKVDKGLAADVRKGMRVDIYQTDFFGGNVLVASGVIYEVEADSAIVRLEKRFNDREIKQGFTARAR